METLVPTRRRSLPPVPRPAVLPAPRTAAEDEGQAFVTALRAAATGFAAAAGAPTAMVLEVVPPARHRRARCRVVLRRADGTEEELTFLGTARRSGAHSSAQFAEAIRRWLAGGQRHDGAWVVADADARGGTAVDVAAWLAAR
jgi:hypothetical protein